MKKLLKHIRPIFYASVLTFGFLILIFILDNSAVNTTNLEALSFLNNFKNLNFFVAAIILYFFLYVELQTSFFFASRKLRQMEIPIIDKETRANHIILHLVLPTLTFWSFIAFIYFNINLNVWGIFLGFCFMIYSVLFANINAYFHDEFRIEAKTHYIYDFLKLLIYFIGIFDIYSAWQIYGLTSFQTAIMIFFLSLGILLIYIAKYHYFYRKYIRYVIYISALLACIPMLLIPNVRNLIYLDLTYITFIFFYTATAFLYHKMHRDLTRRKIFEYLVYILLSFALVFKL